MAVIKKLCRHLAECIRQMKLNEVEKKLQDAFSTYPQDSEAVAMYSLISVNMLAYNCYEQNDKGSNMIEGIFDISNVCCKELSKKWSAAIPDFIPCVYNVVKYLLMQEKPQKAVWLTNYVINFVEEVPRDLSDREKMSIKGILSSYAKSIEHLQGGLLKDYSLAVEYWNQMLILNSFIDFEVGDKLLNILRKIAYKELKNDPMKVSTQLDIILSVVEKFAKLWVASDVSSQQSIKALKSFLGLLLMLFLNFEKLFQQEKCYLSLLASVQIINEKSSEELNILVLLLQSFVRLFYVVQSRQLDKPEEVIEVSRKSVEYLEYLLSKTFPYTENVLAYIPVMFTNCINTCKMYHSEKKFHEAATFADFCLTQLCFLPKDVFKHENIKKIAEGINLCSIDCHRREQTQFESVSCLPIWMTIIPDSSVFLERYGSIKSSLDETSDLMGKTLQEFVIQFQESMCSTRSFLSFDEDDITRLLWKELDLYNNIKLKSALPVMKIFNALRTFKLTGYDKVKLYYNTALFITSDETYIPYLEEVFPYVDTLIKLREKTQKCRAESTEQTIVACQLGNLYFVKFRRDILVTRKNAENHVIPLKSCMKRTEPEKGMEVLNETTDLAPVHSYLHYDSHRKIMQLLDKAMEHWAYVASSPKSLSDASTVMKVDKLVEHVKEAAFTYRLHYDLEKEFSAWKLLYTLAKLLERNDLVVFAFSNMPLYAEVPQEIETDAKEVLAGCEDEYLLRHKLFQWKRMLFSKNCDPLVAGEPVKDIVANGSLQSTFLLAQYYYLTSVYEYMPTSKVKSNPMLTAIKALSALLYFIKERKWRSVSECYEVRSLLLDIYLYIGTCYTDIMMPRNARCYLYNQVEFLQKSCVPLRTCQYLAALCWVDVMTCSFDDCEFKLSGIETILLPKKMSKIPVRVMYESSPIVVVTTPLPELQYRDAPSITAQSPMQYASPQLDTKPIFSMPEFARHDTGCTCHYCFNFDYQRITVQMLLVKGVCSYLQSKSSCAVAIFKGVSKLLNVIKHRVNGSVFPKNELLLAEIVLRFKMHLSDFYASKNMFEESLQQNSEAFMKCKLAVYHRYLYLELGEQKLAIEHARDMNIKRKAEKEKQVVDKTKSTVKKSKAAAGSSVQTPRCPNTVKKAAPLTEVLNTAFITPKARKGRRLLFEDEDYVEWKTPSTTRRVKRGRKE